MGLLRGIRLLQINHIGSGGGTSAGPVFFLGAALLTSLLLVSPGIALAQEWKRLGPPGGMVLSLAPAADGTVFLGTADGHVFASADRGEHWELRGRVGARLDGVVQRIVADAAHPQRVLAAVWFRNAPNGGVFQSADDGRHWQLAGLGEEAVRTLEQSPSEPNVWIAGTRQGVFRSRDDAKSWQRITAAADPELQNVDSLAIDPRDPQTIYLGTYHLPWKTSDGGKTWKSIATGMIDDSDIMSLRIDARNPQRIFSSACSGIYRSEDGGASWIKLQGIPYSSRRTQQIAQDPVDASRLYAATTEGLWTASDYGETWSRVTGRETDANAVVVLGGEKGNRILAGFDAQGVLRSDDGGNTFVASNAGFSHRVVLTMAAAPADPQRLLARVQGFGAGALVESRDGGKTWADFPGNLQGKTVQRIFGAQSGWWVSFAEGGLAKFDAAKQRWVEIPFREAAPQRSGALRGGPANREVRRIRVVQAHVSSMVEVRDVEMRDLGMGGSELAYAVFAATSSGLWKKDSLRADFRRVPARNLPQAIAFLSAVSSSTSGSPSLAALAAGALWSSDAQGIVWQQVPLPAEAGPPLWLVNPPWNDPQLTLLGARNGVFLFQPGKGWRPLSNGLPAIASTPPAFSQTICMLNMSNGGTYASTIGLQAWQRLDSDSEQDAANAIVWVDADKFVMASTSEGVLEWEAAPQFNPREASQR